MQLGFLRIFTLAAVSGCLIGVVGAAFRWLIDHGYLGFLAAARAVEARGYPGWLAASLAGAVLVSLSVYLTRRFAPEAAGSGIQWIEGAMKDVLPPVRWRRILPVKFAGGLLAMSAGMTLGREGPTIHLGGAIGAMMGRLADVSEEHRHALVAAGAGAGLSVAFNAPVGGILFVSEEMHDDIVYTSLVAQYVVVASITATLTSGLILGFGRILPIAAATVPTLIELAAVVALGILIGLYGGFLNAALIGAVARLRRVADRFGWACVSLPVGGLMGLLVAAYPDATGGGEILALHLITSGAPPGLLIVLLLARTLLFPVNYATGTPGGIFAPQLALGVIIGLLFFAALDAVAPGVASEPVRFAVAGMAALLTATVRAPLTGLMLIIEMTGSIELMFMTLVGSLTAAATARLLGSKPIYRTMLDRAVAEADAKAGKSSGESRTVSAAVEQ